MVRSTEAPELTPPTLFTSAKHQLSQVWHHGKIDYLLPMFAWHNRFFYDPERIERYNEWALGSGIGKSIVDDKGNSHGLYAMVFLESHKKPEPIAGYGYIKYFFNHRPLQPGLGYTAFLTARPDINNGIPFPGILPLVSLTLKHQVTLSATYIPGHHNVGHVLFVFAKYTFSDRKID